MTKLTEEQIANKMIVMKYFYEKEIETCYKVKANKVKVFTFQTFTDWMRANENKLEDFVRPLFDDVPRSQEADVARHVVATLYPWYDDMVRKMVEKANNTPREIIEDKWWKMKWF